MNDQPPPNNESPGGEDPDTGAPIEELAGLREEASSDFLDRVRNRIHRRVLAVEVADWSWRAPFLVLMQWLLVLIDLVRGGEEVKGAQGDD